MRDSFVLTFLLVMVIVVGWLVSLVLAGKREIAHLTSQPRPSISVNVGAKKFSGLIPPPPPMLIDPLSQNP